MHAEHSTLQSVTHVDMKTLTSFISFMKFLKYSETKFLKFSLKLLQKFHTIFQLDTDNEIFETGLA